MEIFDVSENQNILDILPQLIDQIGNIDSINLVTLNTNPQTDRVVDRPEVKPLVADALNIRREYKVPFWEAILLVARRDNGEALDLVLDAAIHHQPMSGAAGRVALTTQDLTTERLREMTDKAGDDQTVALSSRVSLGGSASHAHLQMVDFRIRPSAENEDLAVGIMSRVGADGIILNSGNSYHFYGSALLRSDAELSSFLGKVSLFAPFIDQRWVAHQMIEGACALRISKGKSFADPPKFVRQVSAR
jgi:hypothetical protein